MVSISIPSKASKSYKPYKAYKALSLPFFCTPLVYLFAVLVSRFFPSLVQTPCMLVATSDTFLGDLEFFMGYLGLGRYQERKMLSFMMFFQGLQ